MRASDGRRGGQAGFTLIEVIVALALAALAALLIVPNFGTATGKSELRAASRDVVAALRRARGTAIVENRDVALSFDRRRQVYLLDGAAHRFAAGTGAALSLEMRRLDLSGAAVPVEQLRFYPNGASSGARLTLRQGGDRRVIEVDALTGRIMVAR